MFISFAFSFEAFRTVWNLDIFLTTGRLRRRCWPATKMPPKPRLVNMFATCWRPSEVSLIRHSQLLPRAVRSPLRKVCVDRRPPLGGVHIKLAFFKFPHYSGLEEVDNQ